MKKKIYIVISFLFFLVLTAHGQVADTAGQKSVFKPSGKLWGYAFGDFAYKVHANSVNMTKTQYATYPKDMSTFEFRRIYLGYDYDISERFTTQLLLAYEGSSFSNDLRSIYIKAANIRWKNIFRNTDLVFGQMPTSSFATSSEPFWGYRSLEKTLLDMRGIAISNDVGLALQGKLNDKGDYGYTLMIGNGAGPKVETNKYKKLYADVYAKFFDQKLLIDFGADNEIVQFDPYKKARTTLKVFTGYQTGSFAAGVEVFQQVQQNNSILVAASDTLRDAVSSGISFFVRGAIIPDKLNLILRYDYFNPDTKYDNSKVYKAYSSYFTESFILGSLDFLAAKNVHIMPNIWLNRYNNRGENRNNLDNKSYDLAARVTVYYIFR